MRKTRRCAALADIRFALSTNFNQPAAVAAVDNLTNEMFYVADTGNNRVVLFSFPADNPLAVWSTMVAELTAGNTSAALSNFSIASATQYQQTFLSVGTANSVSAINQTGTLTPIFIDNYTAEYAFTNTIDGQVITFPVDFDKENGQWKISSF